MSPTLSQPCEAEPDQPPDWPPEVADVKPPAPASRVALAAPPLSSWTIAAWFLAGNVLPSLGLLVSVAGFSGPDWQTGEFHDFASLLASGRSAAVFCPFLIFSIACFTFALLRPEAAALSFVARFGIYTGIVLALHECIVGGILTLKIKDLTSPSSIAAVAGLMLACIAIAVAAWGLGWLAKILHRLLRDIARSQAWVVLLMFTLPLTAVAYGSVLSEGQATSIAVVILVAPVIIGLSLSPCWFLAANLAMTVRIARLRATRFQFRLWHLLAVTSWLGAYLAAWRFAVYSALEAYAALPVEPPSAGCYVATAAACGHSSLVGSRERRTASGKTFRTSEQLAWLKCGEIVLQTTAPQVHAALRRIYNRVGPPLAHRLHNRWQADAAYLALKPVEWTVRVSLSIAAPEARRLVRELY